MLNIREAQVKELETARQNSFAVKLAELLQTHLPTGQQSTRAELIGNMQPLIAQAAEYGLKSERDVAIYVLTAAHLGGNFDKAVPRAGRMLSDPHLSTELKVIFLRGLMVSTVAKTAA